MELAQPKTIKIGPFSTSWKELIDITKAWAAVSFMFAVVLGGFSLNVNFFIIAAISAFTVGAGFLLHELAHKIVAQRYGCFAEFRSYDTMLFLAIAMSFLGFVFAAPGAVMIAGHVTRKENGLIAVVGPWTNLVLAIIFLSLGSVFTGQLAALISAYGFHINAWLALFNMIPFWIFDGQKVFVWSKLVWGVTAIAAFGLRFL